MIGPEFLPLSYSPEHAGRESEYINEVWSELAPKGIEKLFDLAGLVKDSPRITKALFFSVAFGGSVAMNSDPGSGALAAFYCLKCML